MIAPTMEPTGAIRTARESLARPVAPAAVPPALAAAPDALSLLKALRRCWLKATSIGVSAAVLLAGLTWAVLPTSRYTVVSLLKIDPSQKWVFESTEPQVQLQTYQQNQIALLRSRLVLQAVLNQPEVAGLNVVRKQSNPVEWLEKELQVDAPTGSEYLRIGLSGDNPTEMTAVVKVVTAAYLKESTRLDYNRRKASRDQLQEVYAGYQKSLEAQREEIRKIEKTNGPGDTQAMAYQQRFAVETQAMAGQDLLKVQSALRSARIELNVYQSREKTLTAARVPDKVLDEALQKDALVDGYYKKRLALLDQIDEARRLIVPAKAASQIRGYERQIDEIDRALKAHRERLRPEFEARSRDQAKQDYADALVLLQDKIAKLEQEEKELTGKVARLSTETRTIQENSVDLVAKRANIASEEAVAGEVGKRVEKLNVELQAPARIAVVEDAAVSRVSDMKRVVRMAGMAGVGTLGLVLFGFSWWEFQGRRVHGVEDISHGLGLRVIGTLTAAKGATAALNESADAVRAMLLRSARSEGWKSVLVTSAVSGEGKTTLAAQLASSLGRAGLRTLLVDGDLRNPSAHTALGLPHGPGLAELLRGEAPIAGVIQSTATEGLWLLPAGHADARAVQALAGEQLHTVLVKLKAQFDFVVIDASPVLPVADALSLGQHADAVVLSVLCEVSQVRKVYQTSQRLALFGVRLLGAVVNGVREEVYGPASRYTQRLNG